MKSPLKFSESAYMTVKTEQETYKIPQSGAKVTIGDICIEIQENGEQEDVYLTADTSAVEWIKIRWNQRFPRQVKILGDVWERGYGEFQWRGMSASRVMPWYFLASHQGIQPDYGAAFYKEAGGCGMFFISAANCVSHHAGNCHSHQAL